MISFNKIQSNKSAFENQVFSKFTEVSGGSPGLFGNILYGLYEVENELFNDDFNYATVLQYFQSVVIPHKIAVYESGIELLEKCNSKSIDKDKFKKNLWIHDMSKFSINESIGYAFHDFKSNKKDINFENAWLHHKNHNPHHPEYWIDRKRDASTIVRDMPIIFIWEMVADWMGAGKTYGNSLEEWLPNNIGKFAFTPQTKEKLKALLLQIDIDIENFD